MSAIAIPDFNNSPLACSILRFLMYSPIVIP